MEARDIMTRDVLTLPPDLSIREAVEQLLHYRIHGAPVVDRSEQLVGMVSFVDLAARATGKVRDVMNADPVTASEDTPVDEIAAMMLDEMVRRVPIVEAGRVVGIVSASDIIQVFLNLHEVARPAAEEKPAKGAAAAR